MQRKKRGMSRHLPPLRKVHTSVTKLPIYSILPLEHGRSIQVQIFVFSKSFVRHLALGRCQTIAVFFARINGESGHVHGYDQWLRSAGPGPWEFVYLPAPESSNYRPLNLFDCRRPMICPPPNAALRRIPLQFPYIYQRRRARTSLAQARKPWEHCVVTMTSPVGGYTNRIRISDQTVFCASSIRI
jgi:hypothetical protein